MPINSHPWELVRTIKCAWAFGIFKGSSHIAMPNLWDYCMCADMDEIILVETMKIQIDFPITIHKQIEQTQNQFWSNQTWKAIVWGKN